MDNGDKVKEPFREAWTRLVSCGAFPTAYAVGVYKNFDVAPVTEVRKPITNMALGVQCSSIMFESSGRRIPSGRGLYNAYLTALPPHAGERLF